MVKKRKAPVATKYAKDAQDMFVERIAECQSVIDHLETCPAWTVIKKDLLIEKQRIDDNWWKVKEGSDDLKELRITALAYMHLLNLTEKYVMDLENAKKQLDVLQHTDKKIVKDYDGE